MTSFETIRPVWYENGRERRLLFYDVFRGLDGKVWALAPLFATHWIDLDKPQPTFDPKRPPLPIVGTPKRRGFLSDVFIDQQSDHLFLGSTFVHPRIWRFNWHAVLFEFDVTAPAGAEVTLHYAVTGKGRHQAQVPLPDVPARRSSFADTTLFRDDNEIIEEWIEHCESIGFDRFFLYDNLSEQTPDLSAHPSVTLLDWPYPYFYRTPASYNTAGQWTDGQGLGSQIPQQMHALYKHGGETQWMGFFDTDEYPNLLAHKDMPSLVAGDSERTALVLGSLYYGNCPEDDAPSIRSRYLMREQISERNANGYGRRKVLVNTANLQAGEHVGIHDFVTARDPRKGMLREPFTDAVRRHVPLEEARLNHYFDISYRRRDVEWPTTFHCDEQDDSIL